MAQRWEPRCVVACVIVLLAMHTHTYATIWRSELSLWQYAATATPGKPRPWVNVGAALAQHGYYGEAYNVWQYADQIADGPWVLPWDRHAGHALAQDNMLAMLVHFHQP